MSRIADYFKRLLSKKPKMVVVEAEPVREPAELVEAEIKREQKRTPKEKLDFRMRMKSPLWQAYRLFLSLGATTPHLDIWREEKKVYEEIFRRKNPDLVFAEMRRKRQAPCLIAMEKIRLMKLSKEGKLPTVAGEKKLMEGTELSIAAFIDKIAGDI